MHMKLTVASVSKKGDLNVILFLLINFGRVIEFKT